ncbi:MAG: DUF2804 domain-containing protein [Bacillota bacterium]
MTPRSDERRRGSTKGQVYVEAEITGPTLLCDSRGRLRRESVGWSRHPLHTCNIKGRWPRRKRWNYWCVADDERLFSVTLSNVDYVGLAFAYLLEFETRRFIEHTVMVPFGRGFVLPETVNGDARLKHRSMNVSFDQQHGGTHIRVDSPNFGGVRLSADFLVERPEGHETLNVVIPWSDSRFQFTSKQNCLPTAGTVTLGDATFAFERGRAFACLDYGRGVWPYASAWNWASCSGAQDGRTIGFNLGGGWTNGTGMTENAVLVDGRISKIHEDVSFTFDRADFMRPWTIRTEVSGRVNLTFRPFFERVARTNLVVVGSEMHQLIGRFSGTVITDDGEVVSVKDLVGWAEEHVARW